jgi:two-component system invasion response regulator UvrY
VTRLIVADDHPIFRAGLRHILLEYPDIVVACEVDNGIDLIRRIREEVFDVLVLDMYMPGRNGIDLIKQVRDEKPRLPMLILSSHKEDMYAVRTIKAGASGYLCKDNAVSDLVAAIRKLAAGGKFISPVVAEYLASDFNSPSTGVVPHTLLSNREYQVFLMLVSGMGLTEIAERLNLSVKTISTHKVRIKEKMQLENTSDFVLYAVRHGLTTAAGPISGNP